MITRREIIETVIDRLNGARMWAVSAGLDHHFIAEIDHLIQTAEANMEEESK